MLRVYRSPQAEQDLVEIADFLAQTSPQTALNFLSAAEAAFARISDFPEIGGVFETTNRHLQGLRIWQIPGFEQFLIFYRIPSGTIEVVRIIHGARALENI